MLPLLPLVLLLLLLEQLLSRLMQVVVAAVAVAAADDACVTCPRPLSFTLYWLSANISYFFRLIYGFVSCLNITLSRNLL